MTTVLVANRSEVARRVFRSARLKGFTCVAVYSDADAGEPFVLEADASFNIGPAPAVDSYLSIENIIEAAREAKADLIHPGYGFLAEDPRFAEACAKAGFKFVGPTPEVLRLMGLKSRARELAEKAGVPVLPGYAGEDQSDQAFARAASEIGYPVIIKPAAGGGGKGMSVVEKQPELMNALGSARRLALAAFGDDRLLLEKYLRAPRHVEVQVFGDEHGNVVHLWERDCSLQRRHQKIIEESPSPGIDATTRHAVLQNAVKIAKEVGYTNAGTCEFLIDGDSIAFMEMNARLQVEHGVTEETTGLDLVDMQLSVALGEKLTVDQPSVQTQGHAVEVRLYAEDPDSGFLPQSGRIEHLRWPDGCRVDTGIEEGSVISTHYDPMVAKIITTGTDRTSALDRMSRVLRQVEILGVRTNLPFLISIVDSEAFRSASVHTGWLESSYKLPDPPDAAAAFAVAAAASAKARQGSDTPATGDPWLSAGPRRLGGVGTTTSIFRLGDREAPVTVSGSGPFVINGINVAQDPASPEGWIVDGTRAVAVRKDTGWLVGIEGRQYELAEGPAERRVDHVGRAHLEAPMPGQVVSVNVASGERVEKGRVMVVVEAMKMEHTIYAPSDGTVEKVLCKAGDQVDRGKVLVEFEAD